MRTVETPRRMDQRSPVLTVDGTSHVGANGVNTFATDQRTLCGLTLPQYGFDSNGHQPLNTVDCAHCVAAELRRPFVHSIGIGRYQRGRGAIKGSGMTYGTSASCPCGWSYRYNAAPSKGGTSACEQAGEQHLAEVEAEAAKPQPEPAPEPQRRVVKAGPFAARLSDGVLIIRHDNELEREQMIVSDSNAVVLRDVITDLLTGPRPDVDPESVNPHEAAKRLRAAVAGSSLASVTVDHTDLLAVLSYLGGGE